MPPNNLKVRFPDNEIYEVPENEIDQAISFGGEVLDDNLVLNPLDDQRQTAPTLQENALNNKNNNTADSLNDIDYSYNSQSQPQQVQSVSERTSAAPKPKLLKVKFPDNATYEIPENDLKKAESMGGKVVDGVGSEYDGLLKTAARTAKTIGSEIIGSIPDLATSIYNIPASIQNATRASMEKFDPNYMGEYDFVPVSQQQDLPLIPSVAGAVDSAIDEATNDYTKTQEGDSLQAGLKIASAVATPGGLAKGAAKAGQIGAAKALGALGTTNPIGLAAAGTTGAVTSEAQKAGYGTASSIGAGLAAGAGVGAATAAVKSLNTTLALAKLTGNSPKNLDFKAIEAAKAAGLDIPNAMASESKSLSNIEQIISKAPYFGTKYAKKLNAIDQAYANKVQESIKNVGERLVDTDSALDMGNLIKETFNDVKSSILNEKDELYQLSSSLLPEGAAHVPINTLNAISKIRGNTKTLVPSPDQSAVISYLDKIENGIVLGSGSTKIATPVPVEMLLGSKVSINDIINWDVSATGSKKQLKAIQAALKEDLKEYGSKNPEWYSSFAKADEFYSKYLGDEALGSDTLKKLYAQQDPEKILPNLNNISDFKALGASLGQDKAGQQFLDSIKREKLADLLSGKVVNPNNDTVTYNGFAKAMEKTKDKELIKYLAGDNYKQLDNLVTYAKAAIRHKARNPNPSGTAATLNANKLFLGIIGGGISGALQAGPVGAVTGLTAPLATASLLGSSLSWLLTSKKALNWGIEAAKKQAAGDLKSAGTFSNRMMRLMKEDLGDDVTKQFIALSKEYSSQPVQQQ